MCSEWFSRLKNWIEFQIKFEIEYQIWCRQSQRIRLIYWEAGVYLKKCSDPWYLPPSVLYRMSFFIGVGFEISKSKMFDRSINLIQSDSTTTWQVMQNYLINWIYKVLIVTRNKYIYYVIHDDFFAKLQNQNQKISKIIYPLFNLKLHFLNFQIRNFKRILSFEPIWKRLQSHKKYFKNIGFWLQIFCIPFLI